MRKFAGGIILWLLLFLICFGLGYPTLARYDPRIAGLHDSARYYKLVVGGPQAGDGHWRFRLLVPFLAKPFYWFGKGHLGDWDPVFFALLVANCLFTATAAWLLVRTAELLLGDPAVALLGAAFFLLNFATSNLMLAGLVDSGQACFIGAMAWTLAARRWWLLPLWGVLGTLAVETFLPFSLVFAATWWLASRDESPRPAGVWFAAMGIAATATLIAVQSVPSGRMVWPWEFARSLDAGGGYVNSLVQSVFNRGFWYVFIWLLPLGLWRLNRLPRPWVMACCSTSVVALLLGAYHASAPGNVARPLFSIAGPLLSLSAALLLAECESIRGPGGFSQAA